MRVKNVVFLCLSCLVALTINGCGDSNGAKTDTLPGRQDISVFEGKGNSQNLSEGATAADATLPNYLVYGFNVINNGYINSKDINLSAPILDAAKLQSSDYANNSAISGELMQDTSKVVSELFHSFNSSASVANKGVLFSGDFEAEFGLTKSLTSSEQLIYFQSYWNYSRQYLTDTGMNRVKDLLSDSFKSDLNKYAISNPNVLFNKYGTHLITNYWLGGRAELFFNSTDLSTTTEQDLSASVTATYKVYEGSASADDKQKASELIQKSNIKFRAIGGDLSKVAGTTAAEISGGFSDWVASLETKPDICKIGNFDQSMMPIWDLTDDPAQKTSLQTAFDVLLGNRKVDLDAFNYMAPPKVAYVTDIVAVYDTDANKAAAKIPAGYTGVFLNPGTESKEYVDANKGAKGPFIYIAYKTSTNVSDKSNAIYDIYIDSGSKDNLPSSLTSGNHTYTKVNLDLNKDVGGDYIYLYYARANDGDTSYLKEIRGIYGDLIPLPAGWHWANNNTDLNRHAHGAFVYLASRQGAAGE